MRKIVGLVGAALLFTGSALAADLPVKAPRVAAPFAPVFSWTGCYIGADVGGAWDHQDVAVTSINVNQAPVSSSLSGSSDFPLGQPVDQFGACGRGLEVLTSEIDSICTRYSGLQFRLEPFFL